MAQVKEGNFVFPGDVVEGADTLNSLRLGPGLVYRNNGTEERICATRAGVLCTAPKHTFYQDFRQKRYIPSLNDHVVGQIVSRNADGYRVDIGSAHSAQLNGLAFENVTRKSKPNLAVGSLVYARVSLADKDMEPELECVDATSGKAAGFGELKGGYLIQNISLSHVRSLLQSSNVLLSSIGTHIPFEIALGLNGRIWVNSGSIQTTVAIANAIKQSEYKSPEECTELIHAILKTL
ncbi:exosome subunit Rrp40 [Schizosaccharomyces japonicus yFS275]|uniref:Ribosomal RNA-processing protein 40 n=1 Tax=Schizosaccharomyces japonicus (strain yFS275 / FY16936) TaxID=402676 RepID=B6K6I8_SCHJY|nr:exosome subunit Rrp40 [Schizosaccharomyces japonicus yFS275]EEB09142.1 exosome subunit Rrp40 [Schizosaccharomyces japonicus yFS275]